jgi:Zn-dependent protease/predicted transcriptional regulator
LDPGIKVGKIFGIPIKIHLTWFIVFILLSFMLMGYFTEHIPELNQEQALVMGIVAAGFLFASVLFHELCHSLVARAHGIEMRGITLFFFGGMAEMAEEPKTPWAEATMALAGPLSSLALSAFFFLLLVKTSPGTLVSAIFKYVATINLILALFNLTPGFPLDGGRILRAVLWFTRGDLRSATLTASRAGKAVAVSLMVAGFILTLWLRRMDGFWLMLIGFVLFQMATSGYRGMLLRSTLQKATVNEVMSLPTVAADTGMSVDTLVNEYLLPRGLEAVPVVEDGVLVGIVSVEAVKKVPRSQWFATRVSEVMSNAVKNIVVEAQENLQSAWIKMEQSGVSHLPVAQNGRLVGLISRGAIMDFFKVHSELASKV